MSCALATSGHQRLYADSKEADTAAVGISPVAIPTIHGASTWIAKTRRLQAERFENIPGEVELLCDDVVRLEIGYYHPPIAKSGSTSGAPPRPMAFQSVAESGAVAPDRPRRKRQRNGVPERDPPGHDPTPRHRTAGQQ